ncbi:permeability factor 2-like isoform X2 [Hypomesus transpacificus]|uniref:permeability factor 2-like isoform X2 n=1 Tax=Hypomesus transpacificus TaxID=137520 RepID=UPI001F078A6A|nr:permeability factor 2-like isoform X2 [Hypomesus transpacificus]
MKAVILSVVLLVGVAISMAEEATKAPRCHCASTRITPLNIKRITAIRQYSPRPHCPREEVIVKLSTGESECLEPTGDFAKMLIKRLKSHPKRRQSKVITTILPITSEHTQITGSF